MNRNLRLAIVVAIALTIAIVLWLLISAQSRSPGAPNFPNSIHSAVSRGVDFVKSHVTGGVGAALTLDNATGFPRIMSVLHGSPAEGAGLRGGDLITAVNGRPTAGQPLTRVVEDIRGITGGKVTLTVQRADATNLTFTIHRSSWNTLGVPVAASPPNTATTNFMSVLTLSNGVTNPVGIFLPTPPGTNGQVPQP